VERWNGETGSCSADDGYGNVGSFSFTRCPCCKLYRIIGGVQFDDLVPVDFALFIAEFIYKLAR